METLRKLDELLLSKLHPNKKITHIDVTQTLSKGFGSEMRQVTVKVKDKNDKEEIIHLIAKQIPETDARKQLFNIQKTFKKEVAFYEVILPALKDFLNEEEVVDDVLDLFAEFYGARYTLGGDSDVVDDDAVMLLEDLSLSGFGNGEEQTGFNLDSAKKILQDLAKFQGTVIAFKRKKPDIFKRKILPLCTSFNFPATERYMIVFMASLKKLIQSFPESAHLAERATSFLQKDTPTTYREEFASIIHFDLWTNNVLNRLENNKIIKNVFVDFQLYDYRSPAADVFFFLWTSVQKEVLEHHMDDLIAHYHRHLVESVKRFKIDSSNLGIAQFKEEMRIEAGFELGHSLLFAFGLKLHEEYTDDKEIYEVEEYTPEFKEFFRFMLIECDKRGWVY